MQYQYGSNCFASAAGANAALAYDKSGQITSSSVSGVGAVTDSTYEVLQYSSNGQLIATVVVPSVPPACSLLSGADGVSLGWMVGGVWLAVYAVRWLARQVESEKVQDDT